MRKPDKLSLHPGLRLWSLPFNAKAHPIVWIGLAVTILAVDFLTGPYVQVAILFVVPVALATWNHGWLWGSLVAVALPLVRLLARL